MITIQSELDRIAQSAARRAGAAYTPPTFAPPDESEAARAFSNAAAEILRPLRKLDDGGDAHVATRTELVRVARYAVPAENFDEVCDSF